MFCEIFAKFIENGMTHKINSLAKIPRKYRYKYFRSHHNDNIQLGKVRTSSLGAETVSEKR